MSAPEPDPHIAADIASLAVDIGTLGPLPGNPRRGDVAAVKRSYAQFTQVKPIVARRSDRVVIAGNHQLAAAKALGWERIAVVWVDWDEITAKAFALADNRTSELGGYDNDDLLAMIADVQDAGDADLLAATGFTERDIAELGDTPGLNGDADDTSGKPDGMWGVIVECDSEAQQVDLLERLAAEGFDVRAMVR